MWERTHGETVVADITDDYLTKFARDRRRGGAGGVTISIDLTYLGGVFECPERYLSQVVELGQAPPG